MKTAIKPNRKQTSTLARVMATLKTLAPGLAETAPSSDRLGGFPEQEIRLLAGHGLLSSVLPAAAAGQGMGTEPAGAAGAFAWLRPRIRCLPRWCGRASLVRTVMLPRRSPTPCRQVNLVRDARSA